MCRGPHCLIWYGRDGELLIGCAHCAFVSKRLYVDDEDLLTRQVNSSRAGHTRLCTRGSARPTTPVRRRPARPGGFRR